MFVTLYAPTARAAAGRPRSASLCRERHKLSAQGVDAPCPPLLLVRKILNLDLLIIGARGAVYLSK